MGSYNGAMDEPPIIEEPGAESTAPETEVPSPEQPEAPAQPEVVFEGLASGKEPWRQGSGCSSRLPVFGCIIGVAVMIAVLMAGTAMTRKTVWVNMERGRRAVARALPPNLPPEQRVRTIQNLDRFRAVLEASKDPYPTMGEFMKHVRAVLADKRLMAGEIEELNLFLEKVIAESGIPVMQLGERNRNEELGESTAQIRLRIGSPGFSTREGGIYPAPTKAMKHVRLGFNPADMFRFLQVAQKMRDFHPSTHRYSENGVGGRHSKFKIQNSKLT